MVKSQLNSGRKILGFPLVLVSLFIIILGFNLVGLIPYVLSTTSHLIFNFSVGIVLWAALIVLGIWHNFYSFAGHLLPSGAPASLSPFLILVECVRILVRPVTLAVRLAANMRAGHIIFTLVGNTVIMPSSSGILFLLFDFLWWAFVMVGYIFFEAAICLVQAYIFVLLTSMYSEVVFPKLQHAN